MSRLVAGAALAALMVAPALAQEACPAAGTAPAAIDVGNDERQAAIAAEIIHAMGANDALRILIANMVPSITSVGMAEDFARRLDRRCASYLWHPGEAVVLAGTPIYKFDDAGAVNDKAVKK